jgi:hypothetical protein
VYKTPVLKKSIILYLEEHMPLPDNFSSAPTEGPHRFFRNVCLHFKKSIQATKDLRELEENIENFINASKQMDWHVQSGDVFRKNEGEKAVLKVLSECERYYKAMLDDPAKAVAQDLLDALDNLNHLIDSFNVS